MINQYLEQIESLKKRIKELDSELTSTDVKMYLWMEIANKGKAEYQTLLKRNQWLENRNKQLENPKAPRYHSLSWQGKIVFCIKKLKRPLRSQEIIQELQIMEASTEGLKYQRDNFISVVLSNAVKAGRLHIEKMRGTRGGFYALSEWLNEEGKLPEKMLKNMW